MKPTTQLIGHLSFRDIGVGHWEFQTVEKTYSLVAPPFWRQNKALFDNKQVVLNCTAMDGTTLDNAMLSYDKIKAVSVNVRGTVYDAE